MSRYNYYIIHKPGSGRKRFDVSDMRKILYCTDDLRDCREELVNLQNRFVKAAKRYGQDMLLVDDHGLFRLVPELTIVTVKIKEVK